MVRNFFLGGTAKARQDFSQSITGCSQFLSVQSQGEKSVCSNYRGITLLSIAGNILARVLLNRLIPTIAQENTPESQCGFMSNTGTVDMLFVLRQIQDKCREQNMGLYVAFVDLTGAFATISRDGLLKILARLGCSPNISHHPPPAP